MAEGSWSCFLVPGRTEGRHQRALTPLPGRCSALGAPGTLERHLRPCAEAVPVAEPRPSGHGRARQHGPRTAHGLCNARVRVAAREGSAAGSAPGPGPEPSAATLLRALLRMRRGHGKRKAEATELPRVSRRRTEGEEAIQEARRRAAPSVREFKYNKKRVRLVSQGSDLKDDARCILYWMCRDQRVQDNWAFLYAQRLALKQELPLHVCFCLVPKFLEATIRHYRFMLRGLQEVAEECAELNISFHLLLGYAKDVLPAFVTEHGVGGLVTDFSPLRLPRQWVEDVRERLPEDVPFAQVDAHNIVPCWVASLKQEYSAKTIRGKIHAQLPEFLTEFPPVVRHPHSPSCPAEPIAWEACYSSLQVDHSVKEVEWATPGTAAGMAVLKSFIAERLKSFSTHRNDPNKAALSNLSPWLHFGQVSTQRAILEVQKHRRNYKDSVAAFVEEAVVRRELAENFCYYNENYDSVQGAYDWAQTTLRLHAKDKRPYLYSLQELEQGTTHDPLWNAAQLQMVQEGKMHGFLRMYWAKKILEWTRSPEEALQFAIYLNDRYELDGRDPNGYVGCLWSICGIHDQGWAERPIFGKIRYMNYAGCKRKFDVGQFERRYAPTPSQL
ncbi:deoxyribodipyrimidine photo-lyase-like isoform X1 [Motacilla alba alba]|uniref:deoxyribodipyrimidine photo-lyase-like isoform X1 n=1 Tax=Motacilla alba alba TaxID=1094192 RepID=UPI0018D53CD8|nr:deoxyribodipyrimidine photo-lyase-like isoform X1 [Motacilla alba alba]